MDINVDDFMRRSTTGYNFQYINVSDLDRIIRNVQRSPDERIETEPVQDIPVKPDQTGNVRMLSDEEINEILSAAELDLQEEQLSDSGRSTPIAEQHGSDTSKATSSSTSSASSIICSSSKELTKRGSDDVADIEDNLTFEDDYTFNDFAITSSESQEKVAQQRRREVQPSIESSCFEFMDSESIIEEVILEHDDNDGDGDSEGSVNVAPIIRVRSPIKPASAIIKTYEQECPDPVNPVKPILDFTAIERASRSSKGSKRSFGQRIPSGERMRRPASSKSLMEEFDTFIKITELQKKICLLIDDVRHCLGKVEEPEDELEHKKREKRTAEFQIRFQRNYLYQINRLEEDVCVIDKKASEFAQKVYQLYRLLYQGWKFYLKNMKYFVISVSPEKLWTLVKSVMSSTKVCVQKEIFDEDDLIVEEIFEKCHLLRHRLKEEASKLKCKSNRVKSSKALPTKPPTASIQSTKLAMYGSLSCAPKRRPQFRTSAPTATKVPINQRKCHAKQQPPKEAPMKTPRSRIMAVPMIKSSSSSLGHNKSITRVRSARTSAKTIDDVVTMIQQQTDPLANSRLLKEVSSALTKMSTSRDAAISPEVNQQLHQLIMETIQNITHQQLKELIPSLERPTGKSNHNNDRAGTTGEEPSVVTEVTGATDQTNCAEKRFSTKLPDQRKTDIDDAEEGGKRQSHSTASITARDRVGDSQSSDSGKMQAAPVASPPKGVDLEISGGKISPKYGHGLSSGSIKAVGCTPAGKMQRDLLGDRKRSTQPLGPRQQKVNYSRNMQYLEIVSPPDEERVAPVAAKPGSIPEVQSHINLAEEVAQKQRQQRRQELYGQLKKQVCRDRMRTLRRMAENPVYLNDHFEEPWQTVSRISDRLVEELMVDQDFGEASFVEEFLRMQLDG
ncbi:uncharacterized protein LOC135711202 [Ochlerotatus camptorhynchus]|uniref:uncharacterized protein LOC135711202 n=1 Tax=Ochlerotatus camptorhynchus TaxID=644619 RepID=UPI0031D54F4D